ncbi:hypothetical protein RclHR1_12240002 [Rhizophagus clarus]|uniref:F-box domain-containing protein n=1 Tax=Rhizophagus clarus TaxID=94130 RepID=A0A2Z6QJ36_9GLOM|nr:hypothetical protein RclHR1_12240002 [Rhizophagus clarus]GET04034.1 hypothetical protein GLOIN_2v1490742 [Rhizophagus clarus]
MISKLPPELLSHIFSNFETDSETLFSCCLVSREWSVFAVSWLWKKPFHICPTQNRTLLVRTCYKISPLRSPYDKTEEPLFDYASFLQYLDFHEVYEAAWHHYIYSGKWDDLFLLYEEESEESETEESEESDESDEYYESEEPDESDEYYESHESIFNNLLKRKRKRKDDDENWTIEELSQSDVDYFKNEILSITSKLCQLFLLNSNKIISLDLCTSEMENGNNINEEWINIFKLENATSALANIKKFVSGGLYDIQSIINIMINICHDIEILKIFFEDQNELYYSFSNLIKGQKNLKELQIINMEKYKFNEIINSSLSYQSHSLRILDFEDCEFLNNIPFKELSLLQNLESLILINCDIVEYNHQHKSLDFSFPSLKNIHFDMKSLFIEETERLISCSMKLEEISLIGTEIHLSNIFDIIAINGFNIKILDVCIGDHYIKSIIPIFIQCQKLESVSFQMNVLDREEIRISMIDIAKNIPKSLSNLNLMISVNINDIKTFFSHFDGLLKIFGFRTYSYKNINIEEYTKRKCVNYKVVQEEGGGDQHYIIFKK